MSNGTIRVSTPIVESAPPPSRNGKSTPTTSRTFPRRWFVAAVGAGLLSGLVVGYGVGNGPVAGLEQDLATLRDQNAKSQANLTTDLDGARSYNSQLQGKIDDLTNQIAQLTSCSEAEGRISPISGYLDKGQYATAADVAEAALSQTPARCSEVKASLQGLWYTGRLRAILTTPRPDFPDLALQQKVVSAWQLLEQQADRFGVPKEKRWDPMSVAVVATNSGWWSLADATFLKAWKEGTVGAEGISLRYAILRNQGHELAFKGTPAMRDQAIKVLATAHAIARAYSLPNDPACGEDLKQLGYADCDSVAPDQSDPVLLAAPNH